MIIRVNEEGLKIDENGKVFEIYQDLFMEYDELNSRIESKGYVEDKRFNATNGFTIIYYKKIK